MLIIRTAGSGDRPSIRRILDEADLRFPGETLDFFWLAELDGRAAGVVRLEERARFIFLTSLGVAEKHRHEGIAAAMLTHQSANPTAKPVYLYTVIPEFFGRFGFTVVEGPPADLPPRAAYGCDECFPDRCVCMVRHPHAA